jgi:hypothetical protein
LVRRRTEPHLREQARPKCHDHEQHLGDDRVRQESDEAHELDEGDWEQHFSPVVAVAPAKTRGVAERLRIEERELEVGATN